MTTPAGPLQLDLDPSSYLQGLGQADKATDQFGSTVRATTIALTPMQRALNSITPSRALLGGLGVLAAGAAATQAQLATMSANAKTTGASMGQLTTSMRALAREFPTGNSGAQAVVQQLTQLGISAKGSEATVGQLARTFTKLSGATGEQPGGLAAGFVQLNRVMGTGFNPQRMDKLADSLTTVAAKSGASATGVLSFAKAIAPMANASGIGETKVLGISAAFSKLGEDGFGAANAFNKMLGDLNKSVRDGSPMLNTYAQIVGKTAGQFEALFKANPAEAITQVVEAVSKGPQGTRQLEQLGLEGVRTQRYLQELSQSGGLRGAIATSVGAYGSGSTDRAAKEAFKGLADATQRAAANAQQLGEALGAPLLQPLTKFTDLLGGIASGPRALAGSRIGQDVLTGAAYTAAVGAIALRLIRPLVTGSFLWQAASSAPVRGFLGGAALGMARGDVEAAQASRLGRLAGPAIPLIAGGQPLTQNARFAGLAGRGATAGLGFGGFFAARGPSPFPGLFSQGLSGAAAGAGLYLRGISEPARLGRMPFNERDAARMTPAGPIYDRWRQERMALTPAIGPRLPNEVLDQRLRANNEQLRNDIRSQSMRQNLGMLARGGGAALGQPLAFGGAMALRGGGALMGALGGPVGLGLTAAMVGGGAVYSAHQRGQARDQAERERAEAGSTSFLDDYRVAMGNATQATDTFAGRLNAAADTMVKGVTTMAEALRVSPEAEQIARDTKNQVKRYAGSDAGIAGQLSQAIASGAAPDEVARMRTDLIKQYGAPRAEQILGQVNTGATLAGDMTGALRAQIAGVAGDRQKRGWGGVLGSGKGGVNPNDTSGFGMSFLTGGQRQTSEDVAASISDRFSRRSETGGQPYAGAQARKEMDAAVDQAFKSGNTDLAQQLMLSIEKQNHLKNARISQSDIDKAGGFGEYLAQTRPEFASRYGTGSLEVTAQKQRSYVETQLGAANNPLATFFGSGGGKGGDLLRQLMVHPESTSLLARAPEAVLQGAGSSPQALAQLAAAAGAAANKLGNIEDASTQFLLALHDMAQRMASIRAAGGTTSGGVMLRAQMAATDANMDPSSDPTGQLRAKGVQTLQDTYVQAMEMAKQRLSQQREFQISMARGAQDYNKQISYADQDYRTSTMRAEQDFYRNRHRAEQDYHRSSVRAERDFTISIKQADEDFSKSRYRTIRDFNKSITREVEDSARTIMDPYKRIATQPIWDTTTLIGNIKQQTKAITDQLANLDVLRAHGVNNQVIEMLGLNDPNNAQQLAATVSDLLNNPALAATLNAAAGDRTTVASALIGDPSNVALTRQKQDLKQSLADMLKDFNTSTKRARDAFARTRRDATADFALAMSRESDDYHRALERAAQDRQRVMARMAEGYSLTVHRMREDLQRADTEIVGSLGQLTGALNKATHGQFVNYQKLTANGMAGWVKILEGFAGQWGKFVNGMSATVKLTVSSSYGSSFDPTKPLSGTNYPPGGMAEGAITNGRRSYDVGEQSQELIMPLDHRGSRFLAGVMGRLSNTEISGMAPAQVATTITYHQDTYAYDYGTQVSGPITVQSQDPEEMARKLAAKVARDNMTTRRPPGAGRG